MDLSFDEQQQQLKQTARRVLEQRADSVRVRTSMASEAGYDKELWREICEELGWTAMILPEAHEGLGLGPVELTAVMEEMGRALYCGPFFSSVCLGGNLIALAGSEAQQALYLPGVANGSLLPTLALSEPGGGWDPAAINTLVSRDGDSYTIEGNKAYVPDGHQAGLFVVVAREPGSEGKAGLSLFAVPGDHKGMVVEAQATVDQTRRQARLTLDSVQVGPEHLLGELGGGAAALDRCLSLAAIALAAEQVGGAQQCLDQAVEYAKTRNQFGRAIGSFQAVKHMCADMMTRVETARSTCYHASALAAGTEVPDDALGQAATATATYCAETYFHCAGQCIQIHGGMGFTWEHDAHLHFKRARSGLNLLGDPSMLRESLARQLLD